jgi:hypothetical protein
MQAFHNDPMVKTQLLDRLKRCAETGAILNAAHVWKDGKGSPVACMVDAADLALWQQRTGIPKAVGSALDTAASVLDTPEQAARFTLEWVEAVPVGQDLAGLAPALLDWFLTDEQYGLQRSAKAESVLGMIARVAGLHRRAACGDPPAESEWRAARIAAMAVTDGCANTEDKHVAACLEAAAWDTLTTIAAIPDTARVWNVLFPSRTPGVTGRGAVIDREIKAWLAQLAADAEKAGLPAPNISEADLCRTHPAAVALKRLHMAEIKLVVLEDRRRMADALLALTRRLAAAALAA